VSLLESWRPSRPNEVHRVVILDNYDSYAYNIFQRIGEITGHEATVLRNDRATLGSVAALDPTHVIISPGPGSPEDPAYFGICGDVILQFGARVPVLGICLGHQGIGHVFGARVVRAAKPMHGKTSLVSHDQSALFDGIDNPFTAMRYHSLVVEPASVPSCLKVTATTADGVIMGFAHVGYPIVGVQFHPESIGTPLGVRLLRNFLDMRPSGQPGSIFRTLTRAGVPG
jgi:anthranilate synthase/aminodeoxychorismate synthase-like glutamine amidotransferase